MQTKEKVTPKTISAEEFDRRFDAGEDISEYVDWSSATRPGLEMKRLNIDLPHHVIESLDRKARERGITRQSLIKVLLFEAATQNEHQVPQKVREIFDRLQAQISLEAARAPQHPPQVRAIKGKASFGVKTVKTEALPVVKRS